MDHTAGATPALIGLDWGTSRVRAYAFDASGGLVAERAEPWGVMSAAGADFAATFARLTAKWAAPVDRVPAIACGMIGSTEGWVRAAYCACPAGLPDLAAALTPVPSVVGGGLRVVPGVEVRGDAPDVMRGEETQIAGALVARPDLADAATLVLPGTHAKWVAVRAARIVRFTTYMTGELFALLRDHSILGRPARGAGGAASAAQAPADWAAFDRGVAAARETGPGGIAPLLFRARSLVLDGTLAEAQSLDFLSGLLVGDEVRCGLAAAQAPLAVLGEEVLCARYLRALAAFGRPADFIAATAPLGLWAVAQRAGLVAAPAARG